LKCLFRYFYTGSLGLTFRDRPILFALALVHCDCVMQIQLEFYCLGGVAFRTLSFRGASVSLLPRADPTGIADGSEMGVDATTTIDLGESNWSGTKQARVLFDYDAVLPNEMSVKQNDVSEGPRINLGLDIDLLSSSRTRS